jgi:hypothetical protein
VKTLQEFQDPVFMLLAIITELVGHGRNLGEQLLAGFGFTIEDPQGISGTTTLAIVAQVPETSGEQSR